MSHLDRYIELVFKEPKDFVVDDIKDLRDLIPIFENLEEYEKCSDLKDKLKEVLQLYD